MVRIGEIEYDCGFLDFEFYTGRKFKHHIDGEDIDGVIIGIDSVIWSGYEYYDSHININIFGYEHNFTYHQMTMLLKTNKISWLE